MLQEVLGKLNALNADDGGDGLVAKNVIESDASSFNRKKATNPRLTSGERQRLVNETSVFWETYYKIRGKYEKDTKGETKVSTPAQAAAGTVNKEAKAEAKKGKKGILGMLLALAGFLATFGKSIIKILIKLFVKGLKVLGKLLRKAFKGVLKIAKKVLQKAWQALKKAAKRIFRAAKRLVTRAIKGIGRLMKTAFTGLMKSKPVQAAKKFIQAGIDKVKSFFTKIKNFFVNKIKAVGSFFKNIFSKIPGVNRLFPGLKTSGGSGKKPSTPKPKPGLLSRGMSFLGDKVKSVKDFGAKAIDKVKAGAGKVVKGVKSGVAAVASIGPRAATGVLRSGVRKVVGKGARGVLSFLGGVGRRLPILGPIIEGLFTASDIKKLKKQFEDGEITLEELQQKAGRRMIQTVPAMVGASAGAFIGGGLGSIIPGPGTILGAIAGGVLGDIAGRLLGGLFADFILPSKYTKSIGAFVTGTSPPKSEMQDFIMQAGKIMPFSNKDQVLGMKTGGAIDQLFSGVKGMGSGLMSSLGNIDTSKLTSGLSSAAGGIGSMFKGLGSGLADLTGAGVKEEVAQSNHYLKQLVHLTAQGNKIASGKKGSSTVVSSNATIDKPSTFSDSRSDYFNSPYSINVPST